MHRSTPLLALLALSFAAAFAASDAVAASPRGLERLAERQEGEFRRASVEGMLLAPGATATMLDVAGPGRIHRVWVAVTNGKTNGFQGAPDPNTLRSHRLEMYWDGAAEPAVRTPVGDFFGLGHGLGAVLNSPAVQAAWRGLSCYWPMPFSNGARLIVRNEGVAEQYFFSQVDWVALPARAVEPNRFQASYRQDERPDTPHVVRVADIRGRGHLVGIVLALTPTAASWWGEGNDLLTIDGTPWAGTGTEDLVNQAFGATNLGNLHAGMLAQAGRLLTMYRWFVDDPIPFRRSLRFDLEQIGYAKKLRSDGLTATAFWYQEPPLTPVPELPPMEARMPTLGLPPERWELPPGPTTPIDVVAAAAASGLSHTEASGTPRRIDPARFGPALHTIAGVPLRLGACGAPRACGAALRAGTPLRIPIPEGGDGRALWLLVTVNGEPGADALRLDAGGQTTKWRIGRDFDVFQESWPVPGARVVQVNQAPLQIHGAYVVPLAIPAGATEVSVEPIFGAGAEVWAATVGPRAKPAPSPG